MKVIDDYYGRGELHNEELNNINTHLLTGLVMVRGLFAGSSEVDFWCKDGYMIRMCHHRECCESVEIESVDSEVNNADIYTDCEWCKIEQASSEDGGAEYGISKWTFYKLTTNEGYDTIRWLGESNGWYGVSVDFELWQYDDRDLWVEVNFPY